MHDLMRSRNAGGSSSVCRGFLPDGPNEDPDQPPRIGRSRAAFPDLCPPENPRRQSIRAQEHRVVTDMTEDRQISRDDRRLPRLVHPAARSSTSTTSISPGGAWGASGAGGTTPARIPARTASSISTGTRSFPPISWSLPGRWENATSLRGSRRSSTARSS